MVYFVPDVGHTSVSGHRGGCQEYAAFTVFGVRGRPPSRGSTFVWN